MRERRSLTRSREGAKKHERFCYPWSFWSDYVELGLRPTKQTPQPSTLNPQVCGNAAPISNHPFRRLDVRTTCAGTAVF